MTKPKSGQPGTALGPAAEMQNAACPSEPGAACCRNPVSAGATGTNKLLRKLKPASPVSKPPPILGKNAARLSGEASTPGRSAVVHKDKAVVPAPVIKSV